MLIQNLLDKSIPQLEKQIEDLKAELFMLRFRNSTGQLENVHKISKVKKDIARVFTAINMKKKGIKTNKVIPKQETNKVIPKQETNKVIPKQETNKVVPKQEINKVIPKQEQEVEGQIKNLDISKKEIEVKKTGAKENIDTPKEKTEIIIKETTKKGGK